MYAKLKTNLTGLAVALGFLMVGYGLGEPPRGNAAVDIPAALIADADEALDALEAGTPSLPNHRGALKRQMTMPFVSFPALLPRQES
jgi:hypothetical protein